MKKNEVKNHAKDIVYRMLMGRCTPEVNDVSHITLDEEDQQLIIAEIEKVLSRLQRQLGISND
jgi:hypothetical protein